MSNIIELAMDYWDKDQNFAISACCSILKYFESDNQKDFEKILLGFGGGLGEGSACGM